MGSTLIYYIYNIYSFTSNINVNIKVQPHMELITGLKYTLADVPCILHHNNLNMIRLHKKSMI